MPLDLSGLYDVSVTQLIVRLHPYQEQPAAPVPARCNTSAPTP